MRIQGAGMLLLFAIVAFQFDYGWRGAISIVLVLLYGWHQHNLGWENAIDDYENEEEEL